MSRGPRHVLVEQLPLVGLLAFGFLAVYAVLLGVLRLAGPPAGGPVSRWRASSRSSWARASWEVARSR
ncbi:hypothetical protein [Streptomyces purpurascens]